MIPLTPSPLTPSRTVNINAITSFKGEYGFLSNFHACTVRYGGHLFRSSEAAFQSAKCQVPEDMASFTRMNPAEAKHAGHVIRCRRDWNEVRTLVMSEVVHAKFTQHPDLRDRLLETGDRTLIEGNFWQDTFWGVCQTQGTNWLGIILMCERSYWRGWGAGAGKEGFAP